MKQSHRRRVFTPINPEELNQQEKHWAMKNLLFLVEIQDGSIKACACANDSTQRSFTTKDEATSPTVIPKAVFLTSIMEAKQGRDIITADIPNAFVQTPIECKNNQDKIIMKIKEELIKILTEISPKTYKRYIVIDDAQPILCVQMRRALYGMLFPCPIFLVPL